MTNDERKQERAMLRRAVGDCVTLYREQIRERISDAYFKLTHEQRQRFGADRDGEYSVDKLVALLGVAAVSQLSVNPHYTQAEAVDILAMLPALREVLQPSPESACPLKCDGRLVTTYRDEVVDVDASGFTRAVPAKVPYRVCGSCDAAFVTAATLHAREMAIEDAVAGRG